MKKNKNKKVKTNKIQFIWYKTAICEKCKQETGSVRSTFQNVIIYIGFVLLIIPGVLMLVFLKPNFCKCCGAKYGVTNYPNYKSSK